MIKLKFRVVEHATRENWNGGKEPMTTVRLSPVTIGSDENVAFGAVTPNGAFEFSQVLGSQLAELPIGAEVYIAIENPAFEAALAAAKV
jgi:hypothetical protein